MATLLTVFRTTIFRTSLPGWPEMLISTVSALVILISGSLGTSIAVDRFMADRESAFFRVENLACVYDDSGSNQE